MNNQGQYDQSNSNQNLRSSQRPSQTHSNMLSSKIQQSLQSETDHLHRQADQLHQSIASHNSRANLAKKKAEKAKKNSQEIDYWIQMQTQYQYSDYCVTRFSSIKDVLKQRVQFNKKKKDHRRRIENKHHIGPGSKEMQEHQVKKITIPIVNTHRKEKKEPIPEHDDEPSDDGKDPQLTGWSKWRADYEEKVHQIKDEQTFFVHGRFVQFSKRSLGLLDNKSKFRIFLVWLVTSKWFEYLIIGLILLNSLFLGAKGFAPAAAEGDGRTIIRVVEEVERICTVFFVVECLAKILAMGFVLGSRSYLSDQWNWLDFLVVVASLLHELPPMQNASGLRTFRLFRPLRSLTAMPSMKLLIGTLLSSLSHLNGILGLAMGFFMIFAILGVSLWDGRIHYRCYETEGPLEDGSWQVVEDDTALCSQYRPCPEGYWCDSLMNVPEDRLSDRLKQDLWIHSDIKELNYGLTNFDDIGSAFLTIFQCITMEGWTIIMNIYEDAYLGWFVDVYFIGCVVICSFFLLNLTIAVMLMKYEELDKDQSNSKHKEELRQIGIEFKLPPKLVEFLIKQDSIQLSNQAQKMLKQEDSFFAQLFAPKKQIVDKSQPYYQNRFVKFCLKTVMNPYFDAFMMLVIVVNTICLALDRHPSREKQVLENLQWANHVFTFLFTVEVLFKLIGLGFRKFFAEPFNRFDLLIVTISIVDMEVATEEGSGVFSALRAFRLFKIFKLFKVGDLRILIDSITFTVGAISDYVILLVLFIYVFALMGMSFFAELLKFDENDRVDEVSGASRRHNFDWLPWAVMTIFQILIGEKWNEVMYDCMRAAGGPSAVYFIVVVVGGNIIMLNLFLAILLGNFEKARNFGQKKKVLEAFSEIQGGGKSLSQTLDIILGDMSMHVKTKILGWDEIMVRKIHRYGDTQIAQDLLEIGARFIVQPSEDETNENPNISLMFLEQSFADNESNASVNDGDDDRSPRSQQQAKKEKSERDESTPTKNKEKNDELENNSDEKQKDEQNDKDKSKKHLQFAKTFVKYHRSNPRFFRLKELNRQYYQKPSKALKSIIEKDLTLDLQEMDPLPEEQGLAHFFNRAQDQKEDRKKIEPINNQQVEMNIQKYGSSNQFQTIKKQQEKKQREDLEKRRKLFRLESRQKTLHKKKFQSTISSGEKADKQHESFTAACQETMPSKVQGRGLTKSESKQNELGNGNMKKNKVQVHDMKNPRPLTPQKLNDTSNDQSQIRNLDTRLNMIDDQGSVQNHETNHPGIEHFQDNQANKPRGPLGDFINNIKNRSVFIFHKDGRIRRACLVLAESPENLDDLAEMECKLQHDSGKQGQANSAEEDQIDNDEGSKQSASNYLTDGQSQAKSHSHHPAQQRPVGPGQGGNLFGLVGSMTVPSNISQFMNKTKNQTRNRQKQHPSKIFENMVLVLIGVSSLTLVADNPLNDPEGQLQGFLGIAETTFTCLFTIEAMIKIIAKGMLFNQLGPIQPYLRSPWNVLDAFVVCASVLDLALLLHGAQMQTLQSLKALRALRALRPLRVISRNEGMRLVVNALLASLPSMTNVLLVCTLFILIFSIMGVNFFKGAFWRCSLEDDSEASLDDIDTKQDCLDADGDWSNRPANFDDVIQAMNTLFQMTTAEGWVEVMYSGMDSRGVDLQPKRDAKAYIVVYFVAFMIIGSQFIINLFVGVVIDNFNTIKEREELGNMFVTEQQKSWIEIQKIGLGKTLKTKVNEPIGSRLPFYRLVNKKSFEYAILFFIVLNTVVMASRHHRMSEELTRFSETANFVFAFVFNAEMVLKLIGLGKTYFMNPWNKFDMFIVVGTDLGLAVQWLGGVDDGLSTAATVIRGFRIMRMFRLIKSSVTIRLIFDTILNILPQITNVTSLIVLLFFIYAALAINLFSGVMLQEYLDQKNNFQDLGHAMVMLMKFSTGEDWNQFMYELAEQDGYKGQRCTTTGGQGWDDVENGTLNGCGSYLSYPFFISFTILISMLIMNLSVAAVIEGLDTAKKENMGIVQGDEIEALIDLWQDYDPYASGWITMNDLVFLLYELPPPLGKRINKFSIDDSSYDPDSKKNSGMKQQDRYLVNDERRIVMKKVDALELLRGLKIKVYSDSQKQIHFADVFKALMKRVFRDQKIDFKLSSNLNRKMKNQWAKKHKGALKDNRGKRTVREEQAGLIITRWARKCLSLQKNHQNLKKHDHKFRRQIQQKNAQQMAVGQENWKKNINNEEAQKIVGQKKKKRQQILIEQAGIIYNIIKGVKDGQDGDPDKDRNQYMIQNEYSWKTQGGEQVLQELNRELHDSDYSPDRDREEAMRNFDTKYKAYKTIQNKKSIEQNRYNNDLFSVNVFTQNGGNSLQAKDRSQTMEDSQAPLVLEAAQNDYIDRGLRAGGSKGNTRQRKASGAASIDSSMGASRQKRMHGEEGSSLEPFMDDARQSIKDNNNISINVGNLDNGQMDVESKSVYSINQSSIKHRDRPVRDYVVEKYQKEVDYEKLKNGESIDPLSTLGANNSKKDEQEQKYMKMKEQRKQIQEKLDRDNLAAERQMRPQINRNPTDFVHGSSGQTIEIDETSAAKQINQLVRLRNRKDVDEENLREALYQDVGQDLISHPEIDRFFQPSRAPKSSVNDETLGSQRVFLNQNRKVLMDDTITSSQIGDKRLDFEQHSIVTSNLKDQRGHALVNQSRSQRKGAASTIRSREDKKIDLSKRPVAKNNFLDEGNDQANGGVNEDRSDYIDNAANHLVSKQTRQKKVLNLGDRGEHDEQQNLQDLPSLQSEEDLGQESKVPLFHKDKLQADNMVINYKNFPTDINIVDKEEFMMLEAKFKQKGMQNQIEKLEQKKQVQLPLPIEQRFAAFEPDKIKKAVGMLKQQRKPPYMNNTVEPRDKNPDFAIGSSLKPSNMDQNNKLGSLGDVGDADKLMNQLMVENSGIMNQRNRKHNSMLGSIEEALGYKDILMEQEDDSLYTDESLKDMD